MTVRVALIVGSLRKGSYSRAIGMELKALAEPGLEIEPVEIGDLNRLYQLGFASWLPSSAISDGVYYGLRVGGRLVAAAGTHVISQDARLAERFRAVQAAWQVLSDADAQRTAAAPR